MTQPGGLPPASTSPAPSRAGLACVVVNPSKPAVTPGLRTALDQALQAAGYHEPLWLETTPREPGATQARLAVASGARLVVAVGGDGTVRAVAAGLAGTPTELGIMPLGTANLAARNLGLPVGNLPALMTAAVSGGAAPTDLAWVSTDPAPDHDQPAPPHGWARPTLGSEHACLVVTGIGFDAGLVASTRPALKSRLKWGAYVLAAFKNLWSPRLDMLLSLEETSAPHDQTTSHGGRRPSQSRRHHGVGSARHLERLTARCLLISNGGRLPAGITLLPQAAMDDGVLDVAAIDTVGGLAGWTSLARQVLPPFAARYSDPRRALGRVVLGRGNDVVVHLSQPAMVEVDGELLPPTRQVRVRLEAGAVLIRR
ncbi:diacylglycerol/lipid kinase family protein [Actinomyces faecalis]|uniref:diacylglycerol/lipid kinase family protein n=1 Tax=Actinomyces faecalis TaxID=2722820 RepID=UPI001553C351|nr:diacylglycerol kinase family protein [Actinomyces faecalis]